MMIIKYPVVGDIDATLNLSVSDHGLLVPQTKFSEAKAGDAFAPVETTLHGKEYTVKVVSKILRAADHFAAISEWLDATEDRVAFDCDSTSIPLVGKQYVAYRTEPRRLIKTLHQHRFIQVTTNLHVIEIR